MSNLPDILTAMVISYLIGAIPTGYIMGRVVKGIDIRDYGSGNVGATNVIRAVGKVPGIIVLLLDAIKGFVPVVIVASFFYNKNLTISLPLFRIILGLLAISGHIWTIFLRFKGGKGVATTIGVFVGLAPLTIMIGLLIWVVTAILFKYVSVSSMTMALILPLLMYIFGHPKEYVIFSVIFATFIFYTHRPNIKRLITGSEYKIGEGYKKNSNF